MRGLWLIDGSYLYKAMRSFQKTNTEFQGKGIDYCKLKRSIGSTFSVDQIDAYYFNSTPNPATDAQNQFHTWLKTAEPKGPNIRVKLYGLKNIQRKCNSCGKAMTYRVQKGVDVGLAIAGMKHYTKYDTILLSAGDGDFEDFLRYVVEENDKKLYIAGFVGSISPDIQQYSSGTYLLNEHYSDICDTRPFVPFERADDLVDGDDI